MEIAFENPRHEKLANDFKALAKKYDKKGRTENAENIRIALEALAAADALSDIPRGFRPHPMKAGAKGLFTIDVDEWHRVVFRPRNTGVGFRPDNPKAITAITITNLFFKIH